MIKDLLVFFVTIVVLALGFYLVEHFSGKNLVESYPFLFGFLLFVYAKTHVLTLFLSDKLKLYIGQLYLIFTVYKFIFTSFYFLLLKKKTFFYTKSFIAVFMLSYFVMLIVEYFLYKTRLEKIDKNQSK